MKIYFRSSIIHESFTETYAILHYGSQEENLKKFLLLSNFTYTEIDRLNTFKQFKKKKNTKKFTIEHRSLTETYEILYFVSQKENDF